MIKHNDKKYYSCRELADICYYNSEPDIKNKLVAIWKQKFSGHFINDYINSAQFQQRLMPLARNGKIPHLECTKTSNERVYFFFNPDDIINFLSNLSDDGVNSYVNNFTEVKLVPAE